MMKMVEMVKNIKSASITPIANPDHHRIGYDYGNNDAEDAGYDEDA